MPEKIIPTLIELDQKTQFFAKELSNYLLQDAFTTLQWRKDKADRITGGGRRTYIPEPLHRIDGLVFGGSSEFRRYLGTCATIANEHAGGLHHNSWRTNRIVINHMPPRADLPMHVDPSHFTDGVVVLGLAEATFSYRAEGSLTDVELPSVSLMHIPAGLEHKVHNGSEERISIALICDTHLLAGRSAVGEVLRSRIM